jgi:hypothetical protein
MQTLFVAFLQFARFCTTSGKLRKASRLGIWTPKNASFLGFARLGRAIPGDEFEIVVVVLGVSESLFGL